MAQGITIDRSPSGKPTFAHIDLRKYSRELIPFFSEKGIELEEPHSPYNKEEVENLLGIISRMEHGERKEVDMSNFWDV